MQDPHSSQNKLASAPSPSSIPIPSFSQSPPSSSSIPIPSFTQSPPSSSSIPIPSFTQSQPPKYNFIDNDIFHKRIETCIDAEKDDQINVYFCIYSITHPFFVEGPSVPINENTNIYGHVLSEYDIFYPCLQWLVQKDEDNTYTFPKITYDCVSIPYSEDDSEDDNSMETIQFENTIHEYFLSMYSGDVFNQNLDILKTAYKGYYSPNTLDSESNFMKSVYVIYDFSDLYSLLIFNNNMRLIINDEIRENKDAFSPEVIHFFHENHFLTRINDVLSPTIGYMCMYNESEQKWVNISSDNMENIDYMLPYEHHVLGCNAYYLSKSPIDPNTNSEKLVKMACIETRIMYEISINEEKEIFYMGDNVEDFKYDFQMGLLMASTFHFREMGHDMIGIKNISHMHRIYPLSNSSMSVNMTNSLSNNTFDDKKEYL